MRRRPDGKQAVANPATAASTARVALAAPEISLMIDKQIERKHADAGENVSEKRARQERQGRA
jgi:hypothetical protein